MSIKTKKIRKQQRNSEQPENHNTISSTLRNIKSYKRNKKKKHNYKKITILSKYYIFICILYSYHVPLSMHTESKFKHTKK